MKKLLILSLLSLTLLGASSLSSLSHHEKEKFLKEMKGTSSLYNSTTYKLKKGWNKLTTPISGVDVPNTFDTSKIKLVLAYDFSSKLWATYLPEKVDKDPKILFLKYLEPNVTYFVLANSDISVDIKSTIVNEACKKIMNDKDYDFMVDGVLEQKLSKDKSISIKTRYLTHYEKGIYNDTRVMFIYPNIDTKSKATYRYGPASPKVAIKYAKEYEEKKFYIYDFKVKKCYLGLFPSMKIPPYPRLEEL